MTHVTASDGHVLDACEVHPVGAPASFVVVQEIFGVNARSCSVVDHYAALAFLADNGVVASR